MFQIALKMLILKVVENMTVQELYDWAKENNVLDVQIAKCCDDGLRDVKFVYGVTEIYDTNVVKVILN
jgi:hypothetical protein